MVQFNLNIKGFTLFTALVGFIVIGFGMLILQHMSNSEKAHSQAILSIKSQSEMESIKDMLRLESFNIFNILLRAKVYAYFNSKCSFVETDGEKTLDCQGLDSQNLSDIESIRLDLDKDMSELIEETEKTLFYPNCDPKKVDCTNQENIFINYLAQNLAAQLTSFTGWFRSIYFYRVYDQALITKTEGGQSEQINLFSNEATSLTMASISNASKNAFNYTRANDKILKVMDCDTINNCHNGSFYINADFTKIDNDNYLKLPRIFIFKRSPLSSLDDAIIPKSYLQFYIPFRIFGAMAYVKDGLPSNDNRLSEILNNNFYDSYNNTNIDGCPSSYNPNTITNGTMTGVMDKLDKICMALVQKDIVNDLKIVDCKGKIEQNHYVKSITLNIAGRTITHHVTKISSVSINVRVQDQSKDYSFGETEIIYPLKFYKTMPHNSTSAEQINCNCTTENALADPIIYNCTPTQ